MKFIGLGAKGGIVVKPNTAIEPFESVLQSCDLVLIMSVEPGFWWPEIYGRHA